MLKPKKNFTLSRRYWLVHLSPRQPSLSLRQPSITTGLRGATKSEKNPSGERSEYRTFTTYYMTPRRVGVYRTRHHQEVQQQRRSSSESNRSSSRSSSGNNVDGLVSAGRTDARTKARTTKYKQATRGRTSYYSFFTGPRKRRREKRSKTCLSYGQNRVLISLQRSLRGAA